MCLDTRARSCSLELLSGQASGLGDIYVASVIFSALACLPSPIFFAHLLHCGASYFFLAISHSIIIKVCFLIPILHPYFLKFSFFFFLKKKCRVFFVFLCIQIV
jgi:hypothetical protein